MNEYYIVKWKSKLHSGNTPLYHLCKKIISLPFAQANSGRMQK